MSTTINEGRYISIEGYREDLLAYWVQRFGSLALAERIFNELRQCLMGSDILSLVGNPFNYLCGYGLSVGMRLAKAEYQRE